MTTACKQKPKTAEEIYKEKMETFTDEELIEELYGNPQNYKVRSISIKNLCPNVSNQGNGLPYIQEGAVVQLLFNKGKIFIKDLGTLNGSYHKGYYANDNGTISANFSRNVFSGGGGGYANVPSAGIRHNPVTESDAINILIKYEMPVLNSPLVCKGTASYWLDRI